MKIVSGAYGGRKLNVPKGRNIRPTSDKIRGAVFNMLSSRGAVEDAHVLDAFCGTGALGLEALSRGSNSAIFWDKSRVSLSLAQSNAEMLGVESANFQIKDASKVGRKPDNIRACDLIFLDPPYNKDLLSPTLCSLEGGGWLSENAWILCESEHKHDLILPDGFIVDHEKTYGETKITLLKYQAIAPV